MARKKYSASFKAQIALAAIKNDMTISELASKYNVHPTQVQKWKAEGLAKFEKAFVKDTRAAAQAETQLAEFERKIGQLTIENDFLKKKLLKSPKRSE